MLFIMWQLKTITCVIFLTSCWGKELLRARKQDYSNEQTIGWEQFDNKNLEKEQSKQLTNDRYLSDKSGKRILKNYEVPNHRLGEENLSDRGTKTVAESDATRHLNGKVDERREFFRYPTHERLTDLRQIAREKDKPSLDNTHIGKFVENLREENDEVLKRREHTRDRILARHFENSRVNLRLENESYYTKRQYLSNRQNTLQRIYNGEASRRTSKYIERQNTREVQEIPIHETSRRRILFTGKPGHHDNNDRRAVLQDIANTKTGITSDRIREQKKRHLEDRREKNKWEESNKSSVSQEPEDRTRKFINREQPRSEIIKERLDRDRSHQAREISRQFDYRWQSKNGKTLVHSSQFGVINSQRDVYRQGYLLSKEDSKIRQALNQRFFENITENRCDNQLDATERSGSSSKWLQQALRQANDHESITYADIYLIEARDHPNIIELEANQNREERRESFQSTSQRLQLSNARNTEEKGIYHDGGSKRRDNRFLLPESSDFDQKMHRVNEQTDNSREERVERFAQTPEQRGSLKDRVDSKQTLKCNRNEDIEALRLQHYWQRGEMRQCEEHRLEGDGKRKARNSETTRVSERQVNIKPVHDKSERVEAFELYKYKNDRVARINKVDKIVRFSSRQLFERKTNLFLIPETLEHRNNHYVEEYNVQKPTVFLSASLMALGQAVLFSYLIMNTVKGQTDSKSHLSLKLGETLKAIAAEIF